MFVYTKTKLNILKFDLKHDTGFIAERIGECKYVINSKRKRFIISKNKTLLIILYNYKLFILLIKLRFIK